MAVVHEVLQAERGFAGGSGRRVPGFEGFGRGVWFAEVLPEMGIASEGGPGAAGGVVVVVAAPGEPGGEAAPGEAGVGGEPRGCEQVVEFACAAERGKQRCEEFAGAGRVVGAEAHELVEQVRGVVEVAVFGEGRGESVAGADVVAGVCEEPEGAGGAAGAFRKEGFRAENSGGGIESAAGASEELEGLFVAGCKEMERSAAVGAVLEGLGCEADAEFVVVGAESGRGFCCEGVGLFECVDFVCREGVVENGFGQAGERWGQMGHWRGVRVFPGVKRAVGWIRGGVRGGGCVREGRR